MKYYDVIIIGSGPGGYVSAIRSSQLGFKTAIIEKEKLGGVCLNWGCIPTKALLKSAEIFNYIKNLEKYGIDKIDPTFKFINLINRSRQITKKMNEGVEFLMKKNNIDVIFGTAKLKNNKKVSVLNKNNISEFFGKNIIIATGSKSKEISNLKQDGDKIIGYREALSLKKQPKSLIIIGSGAIGIEFAYFYASIGTKVTIIEGMSQILPSEDIDISIQLKKSLEKIGIVILTNSYLENITISSNKVTVFITNKGEKEILHSDLVLSAIGIEANINNIGLEEVGIKTNDGKILVDDFYKTNIDGYYAIGDVLKTPSLAHVASAEGLVCIEKIKGLKVEKINYKNIPKCTYSVPEIASVGYTEIEAKSEGYNNLKIGKFPFSASGKAIANGAFDGFVKVIFDGKYGEWLGCHIIGNGITEMISGVVIARNLETTSYEILNSIHPHPTLSESIMEAVAAAYKKVIHI